MELHDSLQWWQFGIRFAWLVLFVVGVHRLVRRKRSNRAIALTMMGVAVVGFLVTRSLTEPAVHRVPASGSASKVERVHVVTERTFDSNDDPAVTLEAPDGWKLSFVDAEQMVVLEANNVHLTIQSAHLQEDVDVGHLMSLVNPHFEAQGFAATPAFDDVIDGLVALGQVVRRADESVCSWLVKRGRRYVTTVQCVASGKPDARDGCLAVVQRIRWRTPATL